MVQAVGDIARLYRQLNMDSGEAIRGIADKYKLNAAQIDAILKEDRA